MVSFSISRARLIPSKKATSAPSIIRGSVSSDSLKTLAVNGSDLIAAGMKPGKKIGEKLEELLELVIDDPDMNTKEKLLQYLG